MHIGLIGGIGVAATIVYYQRLVAEAARRGVARLDLTIVHADIQELIRNNTNDRREEQARAQAEKEAAEKEAAARQAASMPSAQWAAYSALFYSDFISSHILDSHFLLCSQA